MLIGKELRMYQRSKLPPPPESCNQRRVAMLPVTQPNHQKTKHTDMHKAQIYPLVQSAIPAYIPHPWLWCGKSAIIMGNVTC